MESNYNFILSELLANSDDTELIEGFIAELVEKKIAIQVEYLSAEWFTTNGYENIKTLLDKALYASQQKLKGVKDQNFEAAADFRSKENEYRLEIENLGYNLVIVKMDEFALYKVDIDKNPRKIKFSIYTNSGECMGLVERIHRGNV